MIKAVLFISLIFILSMTACSPAALQAPAQPNDKLTVVATTSIVGDIVKQVGGELVEVTILLPIGADPHVYEPAPQDVARISNAQVVFANGVGLEEFLESLIENAGAADILVEVSEGVELKDFAVHHQHDHEHEDEHMHDHDDEHELDHDDEHENGHHHESGDPHTWVSPHNVKVWVENIRSKLVEIDPTNAETYNANAASYQSELDQLDLWVQEQVAQIPEENRKIVTDHMVFGYFADRYSFEQVGAIIPGYSTIAAPSAREVATIEDAIRDLDVKAVFVGETVNPSIAQRVAADTGIQLVVLYHGSLSEPDGPAANYLDYIRYNVTAIVNALK
jgi:ABC-type Zn uptake system ZnuABC Zn-binding protein ZnuA